MGRLQWIIILLHDKFEQTFDIAICPITPLCPRGVKKAGLPVPGLFVLDSDCCANWWHQRVVVTTPASPAWVE